MSMGDDPVIRAGLDAIWKKNSEATVGIFAIQNGEIVDHGSGVLFRIADAFFILTAGHVAYAAHYKVPMAIVSSAGSLVPIEKSAASWYGISGKYDEVRDIGIIRISRDIAESQAPSRRFIQAAEIDAGSEIRDASYSIMGYPNEGRKRHVGEYYVLSTILGYVAAPYRGEPLEGYDKESHILLSYSEGDSVDMNEMARSVPHPEGMSGGGIWLLNVAKGDSSLVAIQSAYLKSREYAKGVWIVHALKLIWIHHPELRPSLRLYFPPLGPND